jgi:hypothetical protein
VNLEERERALETLAAEMDALREQLKTLSSEQKTAFQKRAVELTEATHRILAARVDRKK